eukprot:365584-Chlamydomonas_euryale.AAC.4
MHASIVLGSSSPLSHSTIRNDTRQRRRSGPEHSSSMLASTNLRTLRNNGRDRGRGGADGKG